MATVEWAIGAQRDLREVVDYIARDSPTYAASVAERIVLAVDRLRRYPRLGRVVPEYDTPSLRELVVGNYRIVYRHHRSRVGVLAIVHGSRDMLSRRAAEPWDFG